MQYFSHVSHQKNNEIFYKSPESFSKKTERDLLQFALGAALYIPATLPNIKDRLFSNRLSGLVTAVICLEDAISDHEVDAAEKKIIQELKEMNNLIQLGFLVEDDLPLLFIRVRNPEQLQRLLVGLDHSARVLTGIAIPKFSSKLGRTYLELIHSYSKGDSPLYALPILESQEIIYKETRDNELKELSSLFNQYRGLILNIRIGATDLSGLYGLRRSMDLTVYDLAVMRDMIAAIVNTFGRADNYFTISAPVWEYFSKTGIKNEDPLIFGHSTSAEVGLIREVHLDYANGLIGKTVIHPTHISIVQALQVVSFEDYSDAITILEGAGSQMGVLKSKFANKMNECKPHLFWAEKTIMKSKIYGVFYEERTYSDLISATAKVPDSERYSSRSKNRT